ncbi:hypothetical protein OSB04_002792 [Centaurea solstitialis]|uniref:Uncharacterized protein n=1 Tax=Centaurea solstitialis TaxID=347529 RepID=A0AA38WVG2_9ASTR|nr:hypothetical protein OSB04_002792 [Centaurea solstitialis]
MAFRYRNAGAPFAGADKHAAKEDDVPTLYVYDDSPMCSGGNVGGDANTEGDANVVETEEPHEEEDVEGDEEEEEEEEEEDPLPDFDNYVFDTSTLDDEENKKRSVFCEIISWE